MHKKRVRAYTLLFIVAVIWGIAGPIIKLTLQELPPNIFLTYRLFISAVIAVVYFIFSKVRFPKDKTALIQLTVYAVLNSVLTLGLLFAGMANTSLLDMTIIQSLGPLIVVIFGYIFLKDHITIREKTGITLAFLATLIVVLEPVIKGHGTQGAFVGNVLIFLSLVTNAASSIFLKKLLRKKVQPALISNLSFVIGFFAMFAITLSQRPLEEVRTSITTLPPIYHLGVVYMAVFSGTIAYTLANIAQKTIEVSEAALFSYLNPVFSAILAVIWLGEIPSYLFIFCSILICIGVVIAENKKDRFASSKG